MITIPTLLRDGYGPTCRLAGGEAIQAARSIVRCWPIWKPPTSGGGCGTRSRKRRRRRRTGAPAPDAASTAYASFLAGHRDAGVQDGGERGERPRGTSSRCSRPPRAFASCRTGTARTSSKSALDTALDPPQVATRVNRVRGRNVTTTEGLLRGDAPDRRAGRRGRPRVPPGQHRPARGAVVRLATRGDRRTTCPRPRGAAPPGRPADRTPADRRPSRPRRRSARNRPAHR